MPLSESKKVLIIDDEAAIAQALVIRLRAAGFDVETALNGGSGIEAAAAYAPNIILLDIRMPDMDGFEVNRRLKTRADSADIPVIFLSANVQDTARQAALAAGAAGYLTKPYDPRHVIAAIQAALTSGPLSNEE